MARGMRKQRTAEHLLWISNSLYPLPRQTSDLSKQLPLPTSTHPEISPQNDEAQTLIRVVEYAITDKNQDGLISIYLSCP